MVSGSRKPAVAGTWYPSSAQALVEEVDRYLAAAAGSTRFREVRALICPHAGLMFSGPVAAHAYRQLQERPVDCLVLVGPSHFIDFEGVALYARGAFDSPLGPAQIDDTIASELLSASPLIRDLPQPHAREHSLEMQLPFVRRVAPAATIVPLLIGRQTARTAQLLGDALSEVLTSRPGTVLVASSDLSHYENSATAQRLDAVVVNQVKRFDPDALEAALDANPAHACGGGAMVAVMRAARTLGAADSAVLNYADSGDVSGDKTYVVGYLAAVLGVA